MFYGVGFGIEDCGRWWMRVTQRTGINHSRRADFLVSRLVRVSVTNVVEPLVGNQFGHYLRVVPVGGCEVFIIAQRDEDSVYIEADVVGVGLTLEPPGVAVHITGYGVCG